MTWYAGLRSRVAGLIRQQELSPLMVCFPALLMGILFTAKWCSPDGGAPSPVDSFVLSLHSLETQHARKVRVLHFGDSHIASDTESAVVRTYLQNIFGDGGPGLGLPWGGPRLTSLNLAYGSTYGWQRLHPTYNSPVEDTGLSLSYIEAESPNQSAWIEATGREFRVYFLAQPEGGEAGFFLDGVPRGERRMSASVPQVQVARFQAPGPDAPHRFEIRTRDYGKVRILGVAVEKAAPGVVYSALGLVGARAEYLLKCREETFVEQISAEQPNLIILGYGTNETSGAYLDANAYDAALATILSRLHRAAPAALVILLTPPDRGDTRPDQAQRIQRILQEVIAVQRAVAGRGGAILMDLHAAMGGAGSAERWAALQPPLARPDMTHFTNEGYNRLGRYIVGGIMKLYDARAEAGDSSPTPLWEGKDRLSELLPPLYPALNGAAMLATGSRGGFVPEPSFSPTQIYYFLMDDGQIVVTNDVNTIDSRQGKLISPEEAGCLLRGKASPCDNAARW
jgi:lysophospholipase L1-like esterase